MMVPDTYPISANYTPLRVFIPEFGLVTPWLRGKQQHLHTTRVRIKFYLLAHILHLTLPSRLEPNVPITFIWYVVRVAADRI
jgi:hypothetical protein